MEWQKIKIGSHTQSNWFGSDFGLYNTIEIKVKQLTIQNILRVEKGDENRDWNYLKERELKRN